MRMEPDCHPPQKRLKLNAHGGGAGEWFLVYFWGVGGTGSVQNSGGGEPAAGMMQLAQSGSGVPKLKSQTLSFQDLPRLEDQFLTSFESAVASGCPTNPADLKRLRGDLVSIQNEANKRTKLLALELAKLFDVVEDPPELESITDDTLLQAWKDNTLAQLQEMDEYDKAAMAAANQQAQAQAAAVATPRATATPKSSSHKKQTTQQAPQYLGAHVKRKMVMWPAGVPFYYRDSMRIRFHVGGH